jgi:serine/threonine protein kinase
MILIVCLYAKILKRSGSEGLRVTELQNGSYKLVVAQEKQGFGCTWAAIARDDDYNETNCTIYTVDRSLVGDDNYQKFIKQMKKEAKAIASVSHDSLPKMVFFEENDAPYLVMQSVTGTSLKDKVLRGQPLEEKKTLAYFRGIVEALQEIHALKAEHHNIQPKNIIFIDDDCFTDDDRVILTGFVPASQISPATTSREPAQNAYVPAYDSNVEAKRGAQDVYALGAVLYYALTSQLPETFWKRILNQANLKPPIEWNTDLSLKINAAILHAMTLEARSRPVLGNWIDYFPPAPSRMNTIATSRTTDTIEVSGADYPVAETSPPQVPVGWLLWNGTASFLLSLLLSATLTNKLTGLTWMALFILTAIFSFTLSKDRTVSSWVNMASLGLLGFILTVIVPTLPTTFVVLAVLALVAIAGYLTWHQEWYRLRDLQKVWRRTRENIAGYPVWKRYGLLILTNWGCLLLGYILWGLAISQGLKQ